ncbi:MAG: 50S ribosomal protein L23 [Magnetococcales bacterium]|nr:50S ribosomal protein L23 [Magnetococcales bacterium]
MSDALTLFEVLRAPVVTEKSTMVMAKGNQVVFKVAAWANKPQIKAAVEAMFKVKVLGVQTSNMGGKEKRFGKTVGRRNDWKKAVVRLAEGQSIDFFEKG